MMCKRWMNSYTLFLFDMGRKPTPKHSLERIDNDGNYKPSNCRWATHIEQCLNRKNPSRKLTDLDVFEIEKCLRHGESQSSIATKFRVSQSLVCMVNTHQKRWKDMGSKRLNNRKGNRKLTVLQVKKINGYLRNGDTHTAIAARFKVSRPTISNIAQNKSWPEVRDSP